MNELASKECVPCKGGVPPLKGDLLKELHKKLGNGWQVVNVVPSQEQFETFAREQLLPAAQQAGDAPPQITFFPVYRLIRT